MIGLVNPLWLGYPVPLFVPGFNVPGMESPGSDVRRTLSRNLADFMEKSADMHSQMALGRRSGVAQATIGRILKGEVGATVDTLEQLAKALGVDPHLLIHPNPAFAQQEAEFYTRLRGILQQQTK